MENNVKKIYLCNYGENTLDLPVVDYNDYEKLHKQYQQLKTDNEKLCTAIRNELPEQYDKRVSEAESDIEWGVLDKNALNKFILYMRETIFSFATINKVENFVHQFLINNLPQTILKFKKEITHNTYSYNDFPHNYKNYIDFINNYIYDAYKLRETL